MVDRATNRSRGFGFITFESEDSVEAVLQSKNEIHGKWVEVKRAEPRDGPASSPSPGRFVDPIENSSVYMHS
jgi:heterogeneous nuclear ribonucleoprotein A1/A3